MRFEWDEKKELMNAEKHGVWFDEAQTLWQSNCSLEFFDQLHSVDEDRFLKIGFSLSGRLLLVVFAEREGEIRIISARIAASQERKRYEEGIRFFKNET